MYENLKVKNLLVTGNISKE